MTDRNPDAELRALIHQLTEDHIFEIWHQDRVRSTRIDRPLLEILRTGSAANIGSANNHVSAHQRTPLHIAASDLYTSIRDRVKTWAIAADVPRHWADALTKQPVDWTDPAQLLRAWQARTLADHRFNPDTYIPTIRSWVTAITDLLVDPPRRWTLSSPCPACGARRAKTVLHRYGDGTEEIEETDALNVIEREPLEASITYCKNCETTWTGVLGARELRGLIDTAHAAAS